MAIETEIIVGEWRVSTDKLNKDIASAERAMKGVEKEADKVGKSIDNATSKTGDFDDELKKTSKTGDGLSRTFKRMGAAVVASLAVSTVVKFGKEIVDLSIKAEGVRNAFNRLNDPNLLSNLRIQTRGTIDDLTLMQAAVRARNFRIPLEQLGTLLEFARRKAADTGEDINFLVDSLINGIGRKSLPILDNLQLSMTEIQEETKKVGDFATAVGNIVERELEEMGEAAETNADRVSQLSASWQNFKLVLADTVQPVLSSVLDGLAEGIEDVKKAFVFDRELSEQLAVESVLTRNTEAVNKYNAAIKEGTSAFSDAIQSYDEGNMSLEQLLNTYLDSEDVIKNRVTSAIDLLNTANDRASSGFGGIRTIVNDLDEDAESLVITLDEYREKVLLSRDANKEAATSLRNLANQFLSTLTGERFNRAIDLISQRLRIPAELIKQFVGSTEIPPQAPKTVEDYKNELENLQFQHPSCSEVKGMV